MANYTPNINLEKPVENENFRRQVFNSNADKIDAKFGTGTAEGHVHNGTAGQGKKISYGDLTDKPQTMAPSAHKSTHISGGSDVITAAEIGAVPQGSFNAHLADKIHIVASSSQPGSQTEGGIWIDTSLGELI